MATLQNLKRSISEMSDDELLEIVLKSRSRRKNPEQTKKAKVKTSKKLEALVGQLSPEERKALLTEMMEGEE